MNKVIQNKSVVNPAVAAIAGAVVGAGVATVGAIAMSDGKNRATVKKALSHAKDEAVSYLKDVEEKAMGAEQKIAKKVKKEVKKLS